MNTPRGLSASDTPSSELAVPNPWQNAVTRPPLIPDLPAEAGTVVGDDVRVVELIGRVVARLGGKLTGPLHHVRDVLWRHLRTPFDRTHDLYLRSERPRQLKALLREAIGHHDHCSIPLRATDERDRRTRTAARVLDDCVPGRDQAVTLGAFDHRERHPILHRPGWVAVLQLEPELGTAHGRATPQPHQRRVADRLENRLHEPFLPVRRRVTRLRWRSLERDDSGEFFDRCQPG